MALDRSNYDFAFITQKDTHTRVDTTRGLQVSMDLKASLLQNYKNNL